MPYWYFLSYARDDKSVLLTKFHQDLSAQVLLQKSKLLRDAGFLDGKDIKVGAPWKEDLATALRTSQVLVCLCSPAYSNSDYCGKEFQVFLERQDAFLRSRKGNADGGATPRIIFPILWGPPRDEFPDAIKALQYVDDAFPPIYGREGLQHLMSLSSKADDYTELVRVLATRIVAAGSTFQMENLEYLRPIEEVPNAFARSAAAVETGARNARGGRRIAKFVFVAASSDELAGVKNDVSGYRGGGDWQPYWPEDEDPVFLLAQEAATKLKLFFDELPLNERLEEHLTAAHENNEIVMVVVDAWTLRLEKYNRIVRAYDRVTSLNCALLVPWNEADTETVTQRNELRQVLQKAFQYKMKVSQGIYFQDSIPSADDLRRGLLDTMSQIRSDIINALTNSDAPKQSVRCEELEQAARAKGIDIQQPPAVNVPTAR